MTRSEIDAAYCHLSDQAFELVKTNARQVLKDNPDLTEFIMAMGTACFTDQDNDIVEVNDYPEIHDNLCEMNELFNVCGNPIRFTANGPDVTQW